MNYQNMKSLRKPDKQTLEFRKKVALLKKKKERALARLNFLVEKVEAIDKEIQDLDDAEFVRTGYYFMSFKLNIKITQEDMLRDLVKRVEGIIEGPKDDEDEDDFSLN